MFFRFSRACFCVLEIYAFDAGKAPSVENIGDRHKCHMACNALIMLLYLHEYIHMYMYLHIDGCHMQRMPTAFRPWNWANVNGIVFWVASAGEIITTNYYTCRGTVIVEQWDGEQRSLLG